MGDAVNSPLVQIKGSEDQFQVGVGAAYKFNFAFCVTSFLTWGPRFRHRGEALFYLAFVPRGARRSFRCET